MLEHSIQPLESKDRQEMTRQAEDHNGYQARVAVEDQGKQRGGTRAAAREDPSPASTDPEGKVSLLELCLLVLSVTTSQQYSCSCLSPPPSNTLDALSLMARVVPVKSQRVCPHAAYCCLPD